MTSFDWSALEAPIQRRRIGRSVKGGASERYIQRDVVKALRKLGYIVHHSPNGAHLAGNAASRMRQSSALKADGQINGFPDLTIIGRGRVGFMEVKREGGEVSTRQTAFEASMLERGVPFAFVTSLDGALDAIKTWGI